ncbi:uncharacterized protein FSUBG_13312 [Fusarium subglutinans]|uniref:F-box domain-containing protein n=1 Tax=Gibberella subglutinans TaxID=42677 RepID=A0A8H5KYF5_GIBSU|nr:uncharacterized protein FSUBG_13312 [Fusarium subglutinans]KAF5580771.1 hypothetical protein FSUBG_13312 [Fusarium subglutinans]
MSILKLPAEIVSLLVELLNVEDVFNWALSCKYLTYILYDRRMCRLALLKAPYSAEAQEAQSTKDFPRSFRKLAKRRIAVQAAEPWMVAIVAMADRFIYTNGHLCYTVNSNHLRVLSTVDKRFTSERTVDVPLLLKLAVRDYDSQRPHTFEPLYYAEGVLSCLATQVLQDSTTSSWLVIFELRESPTWVVVQRPCSRHPLFVRSDENYLFWGSKSHVTLDGTYRWGIHCLNLQTRKWADSQLILWDLDGESIGSDVCFEIIDGQFYCVSNTFRTEADDGMRNNFYQVVRFPADNAVHEKCEKPPMRNLWRLHDSEGAVDERWTSLQLTKDEKTGNLFIVETRKEWFPGNAGSQRTCYKKELHFDEQEEAPQPEPSLPTPPESTVDSLEEDEWNSENHVEQRSSETIHVGDGPSDAKTYTLQECFVRSYNPSCDAFIDLVSEAYSRDSMLQLRVQPRKREPSINMWPRDQESCHYDSDLAQLQGVVNPVQPIQGIEWFMDERILVYSPTHMAYGQLRPIILISFDPEYVLQGFPNYATQNQCVNGHIKASAHSGTSSRQKGILWSSNQDFGESASLEKDDPNASANFVRSRPSLYQTMSMGNGSAHGFDLSYLCPWR